MAEREVGSGCVCPHPLEASAKEVRVRTWVSVSCKSHLRAARGRREMAVGRQKSRNQGHQLYLVFQNMHYPAGLGVHPPHARKGFRPSTDIDGLS